MRSVMILLAVLMLGAAAPAASPSPTPHVSTTSFNEPGGARVLQLAVDVPAPADQVFAVFTTAEGWESFAVRHARMDPFGVGAVIETSYAEQFRPGAPETIQNQVVAYSPGRMLALRNIKAPQGFEHAEEFQRTVSVIEFAPLNPEWTRVTLTGVGYQSGPAYDELLAKFALGNAYTFEKLRERFERR